MQQVSSKTNRQLNFTMAAKFNPHQVQEINEVIKKIDDVVKSYKEIGARDGKAQVTQLLNSEKKPAFFACKREYSDVVVAHFIKEKGLIRNKFSLTNQAFIYLV